MLDGALRAIANTIAQAMDYGCALGYARCGSYNYGWTLHQQVRDRVRTTAYLRMGALAGLGCEWLGGLGAAGRDNGTIAAWRPIGTPPRHARPANSCAVGDADQLEGHCSRWIDPS
jgi:hypothetical protein